ncbi:DUF1294 domain-containing protein [Bordetella petrii]|uniref:DUF1294 domain-containing protein n=1 Tax=Bordetella petrii TaxID=94624 RepID=UPI001A969031|nr:cold shock and DUF1294 domain-containing protein [Bordetella petrii]MBO1112585.1 cold shock and DUF1294 domain-containing protein [Bordetella petrii]
MSTRIEGTLKTWNDERGFGFIAPDQGGPEVFVHIKAFKGLRERPQERQRVRFRAATEPGGKPRAYHAELIDAAGRAMRRPATLKGTASLFSAALFVAVIVAAGILGQPPLWALWIYPAAGVLTFLVYAIDKSAARAGAWRIPENTLHGLALAGGWPGAWVAQQVLRHKSSKTAFLAVFWCTVLANVAAFVFLAFPAALPLLRSWL